MSTKAKKTADTAKIADTAKHRNVSATSSRRTSGETITSQPAAKIVATKRVTTEEINKANALLMKAWNMISQRKHLEVDE